MCNIIKTFDKILSENLRWRKMYKKLYLLCSSINKKGRQMQRIVISCSHKLAYSNHFFILSGDTPEERVLLQIQVMGEMITGALNFRICMGISSYPYELLTLRDLIILLIS